MAINYTTLFTRLGVLISEANLQLAAQAAFEGSGTGADKILDQFEANRYLAANIQAAYDSAAGQSRGLIASIKRAADLTLGDLQTALLAPSAAPSNILPLMYADMVANAQTVKCDTMTTSISSAGVVVGTGTLICSNLNNLGGLDERIIPETVRVTCTTDQFNGGTFGAERFVIQGAPTTSPFDGTIALGNGQGPSITTTMKNSLLTNGGFETFTGTAPGTPDGWTLAAGVDTTNVLASTTTVASFSAKAVEFKSDHSHATVTLTQAVALKPRTLYALTFMVRRGGTVDAGSTFTVKYTDAGGASNSIAFDPNALTTSYAPKSLYFVTGATPGAGLITLTWTTAAGVTATQFFLVDDLALATPSRFGNVAYALIRGGTGWAAGDQYTVTTLNSKAGKFQTFFGRFYAFQLPSATGGAETISDALAA